MKRRACLALLVLASLAFASAADDVLPDGYEPLQRFPVAEARISSSTGEYSFRVWVARTPRHRAQGLMHVRKLDADRGMLFVFPAPLFASFWMKNTYLPLDMLFLRADGLIVNVAANTRPLTTAAHRSSEPVTAVLELPGGTAARLGIAAGDRVQWPRSAPFTAR